MDDILRFNDWSKNANLAESFINGLDDLLHESNENKDYRNALNRIKETLNINLGFVATFGASINALFPVIEQLMKRESVEITTETIVLLTITSIAVIILEEKKLKNDEKEKLTKDSKSLLEELRLNGIGQGIVKKVIKAINSVKNVFNIIGKHIDKVAMNVVDMFAYTALFIPIMNGISYIVGKYDMNLDLLIDNLVGLGVGLGTIVAKYGIPYILKKLKNKFNINKQKVLSEVEPDKVQKFNNISGKDKKTVDHRGNLVKENEK